MEQLIGKAKELVKAMFKETETDAYAYHNWEHTQRVLKAVDLITSHTPELNEEDKIVLELAAIFHDCGYARDKSNHELIGAKEAEAFLKSENVSDEVTLKVKRLIMATKMGHIATDDLEKVIMDADLAHLGEPDYFEKAFVNLKKEISQLENRKIKKKDWTSECIKFLKTHNYLTSYAREHFGAVKKINIEKLEALEKEALKKEKANKKGPSKADSPLKGVETMYKVALRNHLDLSSIADNKANTLISVNAIIISIVLSALFPKLDSNPFLFYPGLSILLFTIVTIILSILSTIPNLNNRGKVTKDEVMKGMGNLTFFGNFHKMELKEYEWSMNQLMNDKAYLYNTLSRDLYFLGKVLNKKYKLLRYAYYAFVIGLVASIAIFIVSINSVIHA